MWDSSLLVQAAELFARAAGGNPVNIYSLPQHLHEGRRVAPRLLQQP